MLRRCLPLLIVLLAWPAPGPAATRWFDLEIVVFARDGAPAGNEVWPETVALPDTGEARPPNQRITAGRLAGAADRLRRQPGYRVLLHTAWRQPTGSRERVPWIRVSDGGDVTASPGLDGMVRLSLRRYLHIDLDLVVSREIEVPVARPDPAPGAVAIPLGAPEPTARPASPAAYDYRRVLQPFRMIDSRRMRSDELHYIDHPAFGVLVIATAYEPPVPAEPAVEKEASSADPAAEQDAESAPAPAGTTTTGTTPNPR
ncbi:MAG: CsiV family protein [Gammaproteobacteria bacterium]|nr:CsiV family protein [Gammaproteobacteria bacterium]